MFAEQLSMKAGCCLGWGCASRV